MHTEIKEIKEIPLTDIMEPEECVRTTIVLEKLEELAASIRLTGVIQPVKVKKVNEKYEIVFGHRRYLASQMAGQLTIPAIIMDGTEGNPEIQKMHENYFREDVSPIDEGKWFVGMAQKQNSTIREIAKFCSKSESYVSSRMALVNGDPTVLAALEAGHINFSQSHELLLTKDNNIRAELLRICIESGATTSTIRLMRYDFEKSNRTQKVEEPAEGSGTPHAPTEKYLIVCPTCCNKYDVNQIYPLSVCRHCHDGILEGAQTLGGQEQ